MPAFAPALEQIHAIGADIGLVVEFAPPDAVDIVVLIQKYLAVHGPELFRGVHIEDEDAAGVQGLPGAPDGGFAVGRIQDIVQAPLAKK